MFRIDSSTAVASLPTPATPGTPGYFTSGNAGPGTPVPATNLTNDWCNSIQEEIVGVVVASGQTLSKTNNGQLLQAIQTLTRIKLTANTTFYVSPSGSDSNNGLSSGTAFLTLQHAFNVLLANYDLAGFQAAISLANGTYAAGLAASGLLIGQATPLLITGNIGSPSSVIVEGAITAAQGLLLTVQGVQLTVGTGFQLSVAGGGGINFGNVNFVGGGSLSASVHADIGGTIASIGPYTVSGGGATFADADSPGARIVLNQACTISGTPNYSTAFAYATQAGFILATSSTFSGSATGVRYSASLNGVINTGGGGSSFFPGNSSGTTATGGQYN